MLIYTQNVFDFLQSSHSQVWLGGLFQQRLTLLNCLTRTPCPLCHKQVLFLKKQWTASMVFVVCFGRKENICLFSVYHAYINFKNCVVSWFCKQLKSPTVLYGLFHTPLSCCKLYYNFLFSINTGFLGALPSFSWNFGDEPVHTAENLQYLPGLFT